MSSRNEPSGHTIAAVIIISLALLLGVLNKVDVITEEFAFLRYCERVEAYRETDGELGHRDYRDLWNECKEVLYENP